MKDAIKTGLLTGSLFGGAWVLIISPILALLAIFTHPLIPVALAVLTFTMAGVPFGMAMAAFGAYQAGRFRAMDLVPRQETLIHQGGANHFVGIEGVGGWLYLTDHALRFTSHEINIQRHELVIPLCDIADAVPSQTLGLLPNGLLVRTNDGRSERFVVGGRKKWSRTILKAKMAFVAAPSATVNELSG